MPRGGDFENLWIWDRVGNRLSWYYAVSTNRMPAKYLIARRIPAGVDLDASEAEMWSAHGLVTERFLEAWSDIRQGRKELADFEVQEPSLMDLSVALVLRMLSHCNFCQWNCGVNRVEGKKHGTCQLDSESRVGSYFHHPSEELVFRGTRGSGTIFFTSCNLRCQFCTEGRTYVATDQGPRRISALFESAGYEVEYENGKVRFPEDLWTYSFDGRPVRISKVFKHDYEDNLIEINPFYAPPLRLTPLHEILVDRGVEGRLVKVPARDVEPSDRVAIPLLSTRREVGRELDTADILTSAAAGLTFRTQAWRRLPALLEAVSMHRDGATSKEIGERTGFHPTYVRKLLGMIRKDGFPRPRRSNDVVEEGGRLRLKTEKRPGIPVRVPLNRELAEFLGYYCAEGHTSRYPSRPSSWKVVLSFGHHEANLVRRTASLVRKLFEITPRILKRRTTITVEVDKASLALLLKALCGSNARDKRVPVFLFQAPPDVAASFLEAYAKGDGSISGNYLTMATVSEDLAMGVYALHVRLGHLPSFGFRKPPEEGIIEGRRVRQSPCYTVRVHFARLRDGSWRTAKKVRYEYADGYILAPIRRVRQVFHSGPVYNLEVEDPSHTYTANFLGVGNCQNANISEDKWNGTPVTPSQLAAASWQLRMEGCHNVNWVGGDPTIHLHTIVQAIAHLARGEVDPGHLAQLKRAKADRRPYWIREEHGHYDGEFNVPMLWNSNFFMSEETVRILRPLIDVWLPDFKFGNDKCSVFLSRTPWYWETVSRNHRLAYDWGEDMVVRHLVMPGHVECCTKPVLEWIAEHIPESLVNVMDQYHPDYACDPASAAFDPQYRELARRPLQEEIRAAYDHARALGLRFEDITFERAVARS